MGIFVCDNCGCVENTALGHFWSKDRIQLMGFALGTALCSECMPSLTAKGNPIFQDDTLIKPGHWHGKFPKVQWDGKREVMNRTPIKKEEEPKNKTRLAISGYGRSSMLRRLVEIAGRENSTIEENQPVESESRKIVTASLYGRHGVIGSPTPPKLEEIQAEERKTSPVINREQRRRMNKKNRKKRKK